MASKMLDESSSRPSLGAHLASIGDLAVEPVNEGSNAEGQGILKNWQFGLQEHTRVQNISLLPS